MTKDILQEIRRNIKADARTVFSWARMRGLHPVTTTKVLRGEYNLETPMAQRIFAQARLDGYLQDDFSQAA